MLFDNYQRFIKNKLKEIYEKDQLRPEIKEKLLEIKK